MYPVDYNGVRVLTTEQLAQAYECEPQQIKQNFNNKKGFCSSAAGSAADISWKGMVHNDCKI